MSFTPPIKASKLAALLGLELHGADVEISGLNSLEEASSTELSFFSNPKYAPLLQTSKACAIIAQKEAIGHFPSIIVSANPYMDFAKAGAVFYRKQGEGQGISTQASIDVTAKLGQGCIVYPFAFIGPRAVLGKNCEVFPGAYIGEDVVIGDDSVIFPNACILQGVQIGTRCVIQPGAVIGAEGFGFIRLGGRIEKIPQTGSVLLDDDVEVGANSCIDKAHVGTTTLHQSTKLDNLVQIGHNVHVGEQSLLVAQVGIAGSTKLGKRVTLAGQVGVGGHITIGDDVAVAGQSGIPSSIPAGSIGGGVPFMPKGAYTRYLTLMPRLPELHKRIRRLEKELENLKQSIED